MSFRPDSIALKIINFLIFLTFDLMLLGAGVRAMNAGLTCPDWPLCFGVAVPKYHFGVYLEFIHRAIAGFLFLSYLGFCFYVYKKKYDKNLKKYVLIGLFILLSQVIMGGLTVLALLKSGIVTAHLVLAASFLLVLKILKAQILHKEHLKFMLTKKQKILLFTSGLVFLIQFVLGGFVASTYAGKLCLDFPLCNGEWVPSLEGPLGLQVLHRFFAYALSLFAALVFIFFVFQKNQNQKIKNIATKFFLLVLTQVMIGIMNLKMIIPAWLTVIHLGFAVLILMTLVDFYILVFSDFKLKNT